MKSMALIGVLLLAASGCGGVLGGAACTTEYRLGLAVSVLSASTGAPICNATVTATDGAYREVLSLVQVGLLDGGFECAYTGAGERAGTYEVDAKAGSSEKTLAAVVVTRDACHVVPRALTIDI